MILNPQMGILCIRYTNFFTTNYIYCIHYTNNYRNIAFSKRASRFQHFKLVTHLEKEQDWQVAVTWGGNRPNLGIRGCPPNVDDISYEIWKWLSNLTLMRKKRGHWYVHTSQHNFRKYLWSGWHSSMYWTEYEPFDMMLMYEAVQCYKTSLTWKRQIKRNLGPWHSCAC